MDTVIEVQGLEKRYGRTSALSGLDLSVRAGEVHGFLGPNGAGKSTTIRILLGLARRTGGTARVFGLDPWRDAVALHRRLGYVPGDVSLWPTLSGGEAIDFLSRLRGGGVGPQYAQERARLIEVLQFDPRVKGRAYSKGNRQKVALIAALATPCDLLLLDEPTSGLDPLMEAVFDREIATAAARGTTVLLSSHILSEVEHLCDRVTIIRAGITAETGTLAELRHLTRTQIAFDAGASTDDQLAGIPGSHDLVVDGTRAHFTADSDALAPVLAELARLDVRGLTVAPPSLEELFLRHYGDDSVSSATGAGASASGAAAPQTDAAAPR